jgi:hypothetical protein
MISFLEVFHLRYVSYVSNPYFFINVIVFDRDYTLLRLPLRSPNCLQLCAALSFLGPEILAGSLVLSLLPAHI